MTANPPDTIYLQWHHPASEGVTWCDERVNDDDIEYHKDKQSHRHENELSIISDYLEECEHYAKIMHEIILCFGLNSDSHAIEKHMTPPQKKLYHETLNG